MNAIQPPRRNTVHPVERHRVGRTGKVRHRRHASYRLMAIETTAKLVVNIAISTAAVSALVQLLPYHWSQETKLQEIRKEVKQIEGRVNRQRSEFSRYFDPQQAKSIMQEQSHRVDPTQRPIVWTDKDAAHGEEPVQSP